MRNILAPNKDTMDPSLQTIFHFAVIMAGSGRVKSNNNH